MTDRISRIQRPNIILIEIDATRHDHLSCYGYHRRTTPNIDRLAEEGVLYEQAISPASWTLPSNASLFTGLYPSQHGTGISHQQLAPHLTTIAEVLDGQGYQTARFSSNVWVSPTFGFMRGFRQFPAIRGPWSKVPLITRRRSPLGKVFAHLVGLKGGRLSRWTNQAIDRWLSSGNDPNAPFFMFVLYGDPHLPYVFHKPFTYDYLGDRVAQARRVNQDPHRYMAGKVEMGPEDFEILAALYDGELSYVDQKIGDLVDMLRRHGILDDTLLVITSDHGENIGDHGLLAHQYCVYDSLIHVPLIIRYPERFPAGQRITAQVQTHDLFRTILDLLDLDPGVVPNPLQDYSLLPEAITANPRPYTVAEDLDPNLRRIRRVFPDFDASVFDRELRALRTDEYKFVWASDGRYELYNLRQDPQELNNRIKAEPGVAKRLRAELDDWLASVNRSQMEALEPELEEAVVERLKALGYF
jgi:arylsulfatase A-like enzyme